jgi:hypothetical protein
MHIQGNKKSFIWHTRRELLGLTTGKKELCPGFKDRTGSRT